MAKSKKIAVFGERPHGCSERDLKEAAKLVGLEDTSCLEFHLEYEDAKKWTSRNIGTTLIIAQ